MSEEKIETETITITTDPQYSSVQNVGKEGLDSFSYQGVYTSGNGTATLTYSNNGVNFDDTSFVTPTLSGSDSFMIAPPARGVSYARLRFDDCVGMTVTLKFFNKGKV